MSLDLLILLAVFVLLPLIQKWLQTARQRDPRVPRPAGRPPLRTPQVPRHGPPATTLSIPPRDTAPHETSDVIAARGSVPARPAAAPATPARRDRSTRRRAAVSGLRDGLDLRRAIVLTAILGPCRANHPYD